MNIPPPPYATGNRISNRGILYTRCSYNYFSNIYYLISHGIDFDNRTLKKMINDVMAREDYLKRVALINNKTTRAYVK